MARSRFRWFALARATGQFGHIHIEGLGRKLQTFNRGEVGENHFAQVGIGHALLDSDCGGLDAVGTLRGQDMGSDQFPGRAIGNQLYQTSHIPCGKRARNIVQGQ